MIKPILRHWLQRIERRGAAYGYELPAPFAIVRRILMNASPHPPFFQKNEVRFGHAGDPGLIPHYRYVYTRSALRCRQGGLESFGLKDIARHFGIETHQRAWR